MAIILAAIILRQSKGWTYGVFASHQWSFAGESDRAEVKATLVQPFLSYQTKTQATLGVDSESIYDWTENQWLVPINGTITQLCRLGALPVSFTIGGRFFMVRSC